MGTPVTLKNINIKSKVVSMPCQELFDKQSQEYKEKVIEKRNRTEIVKPKIEKKRAEESRKRAEREQREYTSALQQEARNASKCSWTAYTRGP